MSRELQSARPAIPLSRAFALTGVATALVFAALLGLLGVPLIPLALLLGTLFLLWLAFRFPMKGLGGCLALMPVFTLAFLIAKFFGPSFIGKMEGVDRGVVLLFTFILWRKNGLRLALPDYLLLACFGMAVIHFFFAGSLIGLLTDFNFMIAYAAGRVTTLDSDREQLWAKRAIWIVAVIAVLGMVEVFYIGEGPRTLLYMNVGGGGTQGGTLDAAFHGESYSGLREAATMFGPLQFAPLCMAALVIWWVYSRNLIPAAMIAGGLVCSVTRSAWVGTAVCITVLAFHMGETRRLFRYGIVMLVLLIAAVPILGLTDYLFAAKSGQDPSSQGHRQSILEGLEFVAQHPLGTGPGTVGRWAVKEDTNALGIEDTYLTLAGEYGIPALLCFLGFLITSARLAWRQRSARSYVAVGMITGFGTVMTFAALHDVFPLACWLWFPVGLAVRSALQPNNQSMDPTRELA